MFKLTCTFQVIFILCQFVTVPCGDPNSNCFNNTNILDNVFNHADQFTIPKRKQDDVINVSVAFQISHLQELNEGHEYITLVGLLHVEWTTGNLFSWAAKCNIDSILIPKNKPWIPDVQLWNPAYRTGRDSVHPKKTTWDSVVRSYMNGRQEISESFMLTSECKFDFSWFPYDSQKCELTFGSWLYTMNELRLSRDPKFDIVASHLKKTVSGWKMSDIAARQLYFKKNKFVDNSKAAMINRGTDSFELVQYTLAFERHAPYKSIVFFLPCIICSFLTILGFRIVEEYVATGLFSVNLILQMIFLEDLMIKLPPSDPNQSQPKILIFYLFNIIWTGFSLSLHLMIFRWSRKPTPLSKVPALLDDALKSKALAIIPDEGISFDNITYDTQEQTENGTTETSTQSTTTTDEGPVLQHAGWTWISLTSRLRTLFFVFTITAYIISIFYLLTIH